MPPPSSAGAWRLGNIQKWLAKSSSNLEPGLSDHRSRFDGARSFQQHGWLDPIGNHEFLVYVEDRNEPGTRVDRLWVELHDKDGVVIPVMSMDREASNNAEDIQGDNIVVPHGVKKKTAAKM
jgi:hypothetical protein